MSKTKIFTTNPFDISTTSFYPRKYDPAFLFVKKKLSNFPLLSSVLSSPISGGSTPPEYLFKESGQGIPFVKTSAILRHFINLNDLHYIDAGFHSKTIKRSITKPYDVIYSMTGKYMGKAALCPPTINEMNMSQNSVVLRTESPLHSAFLTIFLNSDINRMQVKGTYSITKQKFINQGKISSLHVIPYSEKYKPLMEQYISFIDNYYQAIGSIRNIINKFNQDFGLVLNKKSFYDFIVPSQDLSKTILTAHNYRPDAKCTIAKIVRGNGQTLNEFSLAKGDEIGSANYSETGIPFVKTSDIINFDVDHEPNCYCSPIFINQLQQDIKAGDIVFTKDGKVGEIAIIQEDANIVISSGLVKCRASNELERYFIFLLLSSNYGLSLFEKWFVIASTMTHLRKNFYSDFVVPELTDDIINKFIIPLKTAFELKESSYQGIMRIKEKVIASYTDESIV